jgi:F-type H+-transporting ATPase subunit O
LDNVEDELKRIQGVIAKDSSIKEFLSNPIMGREAKKQGVVKMLSKGSYSDTTKNFFDLLADNRRLEETPKIIEGFSLLMAAHRGEVDVVVTSAKKLDSSLLDQLKGVLSSSSLLKKNQKAKIVNKVNPAILGGMIVEVGEKTIDLSISSRISRLNKLITESV